jgi:hypothetical protein
MTAAPDISRSPAASGGRAATWFRVLMWAGIAANIVIATIAIVRTEAVLAFLHLEMAQPLVWPRFAAFLLILLSLFYIPSAIDPLVHRYSAIVSIICRAGGVGFFAIVGGRYIVFGLFDLVFGLPQAILLALAWRSHPQGATMSAPSRIRHSGRWVALALVVVIGVGYVGYEKLLARDIPVYADDEQHFKYGSIGNDGETGLPYAIWVVLPKLFPDYLPGPGGYASVGFRWEAGRTTSDAPLGFSRARVGFERMSINCAFCHITSYRRAPDAPLEFALAGPGNTVDVLAYQNFLAACVRDPRFTADVLLPAMEQEVRLSWLDRLLYRYAIIPIVKKRLLQQGERFTWTTEHHRPPWGPGRIDPFNPVKFDMLALPDDGTIGNSDMLAIWNAGARDQIRHGGPWHWDGLNTSLREVVVSSALGDGMTAKEFDNQARASLRRISAFLRRTRPPASPWRPDAAAVARGASIYRARCADCHDPAGSRTLTVISADEVRTDQHRLGMWTLVARDTYNDYRKGYDWGFSHFQKRYGYVSELMDGLWLRAPYLHNGSVPTLADLLEVPSERPKAFIRGDEVLDSARGGFVAPACDPDHPPPGRFCFDTTKPGNSNSGHVYGTDLSGSDKADLLAYLLTL